MHKRKFVALCLSVYYMNIQELSNYSKWKECITVSCALPLTKEYVDLRLKDLLDASHPKTIEFKKVYGEDYTQMIIGHFQHAQAELV